MVLQPELIYRGPSTKKHYNLQKPRILEQPKGVVIQYLSWGGVGFLRGACNKNAVLRRGFKQIAKEWRGMKHKLYIFQNFTNNLATQIA